MKAYNGIKNVGLDHNGHTPAQTTGRTSRNTGRLQQGPGGLDGGGAEGGQDPEQAAAEWKLAREKYKGYSATVSTLMGGMPGRIATLQNGNEENRKQHGYAGCTRPACHDSELLQPARSRGPDLRLARSIDRNARADGSPGERVVAFSFYPQRRSPTPERLTSLRLPDASSRDVSRATEECRMMAVANDGAVYLTRPAQGGRVAAPEGRSPTTVIAYGWVHGIALHDGRLYLETIKERARSPSRRMAPTADRRLLVRIFPTRASMFIATSASDRTACCTWSIGSDCNVCSEPDPQHATMLRMKPDGRAVRFRERAARQRWGSPGIQTPRAGGDGPRIGLDGHDVAARELKPHRSNMATTAAVRLGKSPGQTPCSSGRASTRTTTRRAPCRPRSPTRHHSARSPLACLHRRTVSRRVQTRRFVAMHGSWNRSPAVGIASSASDSRAASQGFETS